MLHFEEKAEEWQCANLTLIFQSIRAVIINYLLFQNRTDIPLAVQDTHHCERVLARYVVDAKLVESVHGPGTKTSERRIVKLPRRACARTFHCSSR